MYCVTGHVNLLEGIHSGHVEPSVWAYTLWILLTLNAYGPLNHGRQS